MRRAQALPLLIALCLSTAAAGTPAGADDRLDWWREARFGLFIHWGLYAIPAGTGEGRTVGGVGEWIQHIGRIGPDEYAALVPQFNPVKFDADRWAAIAADAGMGYVVITTKHHDGFCLFDSAQTDYDVMSTPFGRDVMEELSEACRRRGLRIGWYHSILDWHHPDYLPRQDWDPRPEAGADYDHYLAYLSESVRELLTDYGLIDIMWFDGEWEPTWSHADGLAMYDLVRSLQPGSIVNNRVDTGREGMAGLTRDGGEFAGDFGTPEQEVPPKGLPGVAWETCMTMNDTWGYRSDDQNWKSAATLIQTLADVASKGGNFLLNVGPTALGEIPAPSAERLGAIGRWMRANGESIRGTSAGPFAHLPWGRCTQRAVPDDAAATRLYLHVFEWPSGGELVVPGIANEPRRASMLAGSEPLVVARREDALVIALPALQPDEADSVVVLDVKGAPAICDPPVLEAPDRFVDRLAVTVPQRRDGMTVRYRLDGRPPTASDPVFPPRLALTSTTTVSARFFRGERQMSGERRATFTRVEPRPGIIAADAMPGLAYAACEIDCNSVKDLAGVPAAATGTVAAPDLSVRTRNEHFGLAFRGLLRVPAAGMYSFFLSCDDGAILRIGGETVVDNDGIHAAVVKSGLAALGAGLHPIEILYFEKGGLEVLEVWIEGPGLARTPLAPSMLLHRPSDLFTQ